MATETVPNATSSSARSLDPSLLAGAEACHRMMATIEALPVLHGQPDPAIDHDDGQRRDYQSADRAVAEALGAFAGDAGFRMALSNYLLSLHASGIPDMSKWTVGEFLTDDGYRPATHSAAPVPSPRPLNLDDEQVGAGLSATWEIEALCESGRDIAANLGDMDDGAAMRAELKLRGLFLRIEQLSMALMSLLDDDIDKPLLQRKVFGRELTREVAHV